MKAISIVKYVFLVVGVSLLLGGGFWYQRTKTFLAEAAQTQGTVIELQPVRGDNGTTYRPVVRFEDRSGTPIEFSSSSSTNPPSYSVGEQVLVYFRADDPHDALIDGWFSLWGGATILGGMGAVFTLIGGGILIGVRAKRLRDEALRQNGMPIETDFQSVELNTSLKVNGRHPFRVLTQWQNPSTSEIHIFRSNNLWYDPSKYCTEKRITVYIERGNPKKYYVDLSFLPKLAS